MASSDVFRVSRKVEKKNRFCKKRTFKVGKRTFGPAGDPIFSRKKKAKKNASTWGCRGLGFQVRQKRAPDRPWAFHVRIPPLVVYRGTLFWPGI
jgi:hypothetical protein